MSTRYGHGTLAQGLEFVYLPDGFFVENGGVVVAEAVGEMVGGIEGNFGVTAFVNFGQGAGLGKKASDGEGLRVKVGYIAGAGLDGGGGASGGGFGDFAKADGDSMGLELPEGNGGNDEAVVAKAHFLPLAFSIIQGGEQGIGLGGGKGGPGCGGW